MGGAMEIRAYRDVRHPDMLFEIRTKLEDAGMDVRLTEIVAGIMEAGWSMERAIRSVSAALRQI